ncbi:MAG: hypothetical protein V7637_3792 [Mycobacteriales bacterium]|jgi:hypothetical protein
MITLLGVIGVLVVVATVVDIRGRQRRQLITVPEGAAELTQPIPRVQPAQQEPYGQLAQYRPADTP